MYSAQAQLADAYIAIGAVAEARFIAEDLVAREPWERANIERFRRTLELLGDPDPDGVIAERLSGQTPFTSTDLLVGVDLPEPEPEPETDADGLTAELRAMLEEAEGGPVKPREESAPAAADVSVDEPEAAPVQRASKGGSKKKKEREKQDDSQFELSANAIDLESILGDLDDVEPEAPAPPPKKRGKAKAHAEQESVEVDLSIDIDGIKPGGAAKSSKRAESAADEELAQGGDIDSVFAQMRTKASRTTTGDTAEEQMKEGMELRQAGKIDQAIRAFEVASRSPRHRFQASAFLGRIYRERDQMTKAIEWFERATQAPAPSAADGHMLLYELADALEATGEVGRALAICIELQADAGDFRDVKARVARLSKVQARG
jgi:tetratricopeptide (TPR) repeat protein